jgi:protein-S-isoprenylcysteine O-methyltransferase Ste14
MAYIVLVILWITWCALHSVLISLAVTDWVRKRLLSMFRYYRILYNVFAVVSLVPVLVYGFSLRGALLVAWEGPWLVVPVVLAAAALFFFLAGGRRYDFLQFIGIRQVRSENGCSVLTEDCSLDTSGVLSVVRHPWYVGGFLLVWARPLDLAAVLVNLVICGYFVVGAVLEERKLKVLFGTQYEDYQQRVSMFFPIKWVTRLLGRHK